MALFFKAAASGSCTAAGGTAPSTKNGAKTSPGLN
jgi:hypothetical protein